MEWIKKNPAQLVLALVAALTLAAAIVLCTKVDEFKGAFNDLNIPPNKDNKIPAIDAGTMDKAMTAVDAPALWDAGKSKEAGSLFVSKKYVLKDGALVKPMNWTFNPPIPNAWLEKYGFDYLNPSVLDEDSDKDGFSNKLEFFGIDVQSHLDMAGQPVFGKDGKPLVDDSTDPTDPKSHPPYHTRLALKKVNMIAFRLRLMSYDANKAGVVDTVQINTIDRGNRSMFVPLGEIIPGTKFKTVSFAKKEVPDVDNTKKDVSELTIINTETNEKLMLVLSVVRDSPESNVDLTYHWVGSDGQKTPDIMTLQKGATFRLPPENDKIYKVIDIKAPDQQNGQLGEVKIQIPNGETIILHATK